MPYYAVNKNDGGVTVLNIIDPTSDVEKEINKWPIDQKNAVVDYHIIQQSDVPTDRSFRNAWNFNQNTKFGHDMTKAKNIFRDKIREVREPLLVNLDAEYMRADERNNNADKIIVAQKKQKLRDAPANTNIESATSIQELKASWDVDLLGTNPYL